MQLSFKGFTQAIKNNGVVVMPTDTVYGIVGSANSQVAVKRMFDIKKRVNKLGTILFASKQQLLEFGFEVKYINTAMEYWPGPVSIVLPVPPDKKYLSKEWNSLAVRIPEPKWLKDLLLQTGPLATTSANYPDKPTVTNIKEAKAIFDDNIDYYCDGGEILGAKPSKIIKIDDNSNVEVIRD